MRQKTHFLSLSEARNNERRNALFFCPTVDLHRHAAPSAVCHPYPGGYPSAANGLAVELKSVCARAHGDIGAFERLEAQRLRQLLHRICKTCVSKKVREDRS